jgi:nitrous oxidase accessory protein
MEDRAAVRVEDASHCLIEGNRFTDTFFAIYLAKVSDCTISKNDIQGSGTSETMSADGIHLWYSKNISVVGNVVRGHRDGIYFEFVEDSSVEDNLSENNMRYGLHFMFSDRCRYERNRFVSNDAGVAVMYTENVEMVENVFEQSWGSASYGLLLKEIDDSIIRGNIFSRNSVAMYAEGSDRTIVENNTFTENGWAVKIMANAEDNLFSHNDFVGNSFDVATNTRQAVSTFRENYWDEYEGYDLDGDGFGDVPHHPVRLFSILVERNEPSLILLRSLFVDVLDAAERVLPALTPERFVDSSPAMRRWHRELVQ